jgi:hypothetical protein
MKKRFRISHILTQAKLAWNLSQIAPLSRRLTSKEYNLAVSHPKKTRYSAEAKIKFDRVDFKSIAELVKLNALPLAYFPER